MQSELEPLKTPGVISMYVCMHLCMCVCVYVCMCVCVYVCTCVCVCVLDGSYECMKVSISRGE